MSAAPSARSRMCAYLASVGRPVKPREIAIAVAAASKTVSFYLSDLRKHGRVRRVARGWEPVPGVDLTQRAPYTRRGTGTPIAGTLMVLGRGPRRDCVHDLTCLDAAARATSSEAHCPAKCPHFQPRDGRISEADLVSGFDPAVGYIR